MNYLRQFSFDKGLRGAGACNAGLVGIQYSNGVTTGDKENVKFRFDDTYMKLASENKL